MEFAEVLTESRLRNQCVNTVEGGRFQIQPSPAAKYRLKFRSKR
jgi:hypothetical protein